MTNLVNANGYRQDQHPPSATMPAKTHRAAGGLTRTHSRTSSGGGSKLGLNELRLTQKEPASRFPDKPKKNGHNHHDVRRCSMITSFPNKCPLQQANNRSSAHIARTNSSVRLQSKEHVNPVARRAPTPLNTKASSSKNKPGFTISSPSEEGDDDGWVSSESGAATPSHESDTEEVVTPVETSKPKFPLNALPNGFAKDELPTPRAEPAPLPRIDIAQATAVCALSTPPISRDYVPQPQPSAPSVQHAPAPQPQTFVTAPTPQRTPIIPARSPSPPQTLPHVTKARSETHSPPRRSPDERKRSMTRPPSTHSIASSSAHPLRPHPLIRAHSVSHGALLGSAKPAPLAPLTSSEQIPAEIPTSSPTTYRSVSPTFSVQTGSASPVLSQPSPTESEASKQLRRTSISSRSSVMTLPAGPLHGSASHSQLSKTSNHDRQRTLSSSSTFAALSNLNLGMRATPPPPKPPVPHLTVYFPSIEQQTAQLESLHPLLPPPYISAHLTMLAYRNPLSESYERVVRAKKAR